MSVSKKDRCCKNCTYWQQDEYSPNVGQCRKATPSLDAKYGKWAVWPQTHLDHWCGEREEQ